MLSANICFFYAISVISLAKALTLAFIAPLIVTAFSPILLGEKVGFRRWTAVAVGFIGSLIVIRPGFLEFNLASMAALATGFFYGFYLIITRKLSTSDNPLAYAFNYWDGRGLTSFSNYSLSVLGKTNTKSVVFNGWYRRFCVHRSSYS